MSATHSRRRRRRRRFYPAVLLLLLICGASVLIFFRAGGSLPGPAGRLLRSLIRPPDCPDWICQDFIPENPYSRPGEPLKRVDGIVVHYVGNPGTSAAQNRSYFAGLALSGETYASSHFLIGLDGEILQNIPLNEIAYCSNHRNGDTISIECCHPTEDGHFTPATYDSLVRLVSWLTEHYHIPTDTVIRHYDVNGKECPRWYVRHPEDWSAFLDDVTSARLQ